MKAKKRRIKKITVESVPKWEEGQLQPKANYGETLSGPDEWVIEAHTFPEHAKLLKRPGRSVLGAYPPGNGSSARFSYNSYSKVGVHHLGINVLADWQNMDEMPYLHAYLCSKSTGAVTSCTRKYFASAGYFRATASYIAYATLR